MEFKTEQEILARIKTLMTEKQHFEEQGYLDDYLYIFFGLEIRLLKRELKRLRENEQQTNNQTDN